LLDNSTWWASARRLFFFGGGDATGNVLLAHNAQWLDIMEMSACEALVAVGGERGMARTVAFDVVIGFVVIFADGLINRHAANFAFNNCCGA